jgi:lysozyme
VRFAIAKATEGQTFVDGEYATNRAQAAAVSLRSRRTTTLSQIRPPTTQCVEATTSSTLRSSVATTLLPVLDLEVNNGLGPKKLQAWARTWLARVQQRLGVKAIIYTGPSFWATKMDNSRWFADNGYRLWIAHYGVSQTNRTGHNWGGRGWTLWQYTNQGTVDGVSGNVDLDRYAGTSFAPLRIKNN